MITANLYYDDRVDSECCGFGTPEQARDYCRARYKHDLDVTDWQVVQRCSNGSTIHWSQPEHEKRAATVTNEDITRALDDLDAARNSVLNLSRKLLAQRQAEVF